MAEEKQRKSGGVIAAVVVVALLIVAIVWVLKSRQDPGQTVATETVPPTPAQSQAAIKKEALIDYDQLEKTGPSQTPMTQRKIDLGLEQGVDMIVRADETMKIGDVRVPMREILDKIKLQRGDLIDEDVSQPSLATTQIARKVIIDRLDAAEQRIAQLEQIINAPGAPAQENYTQAVEAYEVLEPTVKSYGAFKSLEAEIEALTRELTTAPQSQHPALVARIADLEMQRDTLLAQLKQQVMPDEEMAAYGIYVVQPGDNIWNIHYNFLKEYFEHKGIDLTLSADEPNQSGVSSGVGKILKFSETMVYIYNIRERELDVNLDLIHPLNKIVVFNMGQVLSLLAQIDYQNVGKIQFDGENLWIPAES